MVRDALTLVVEMVRFLLCPSRNHTEYAIPLTVLKLFPRSVPVKSRNSVHCLRHDYRRPQLWEAPSYQSAYSCVSGTTQLTRAR